MKKIGLFWGSTTGNQEEAAEALKDHMETEGYKVDSYDIRSTDLSKMLEYSNLIIGCPTWNVGELQEDWEEVYLEYRKLNFSNITGAFFGAGDQISYSFNYLDAVGLLAKPFIENGGKLVGKWPTEGYEFDESEAALDHINKLSGMYDGDEDFYGDDLDRKAKEQRVIYKIQPSKVNGD